jgi:hypothetical protein
MAELGELLHAASPPAFDEADLDDLRRRVAHRRRTRRSVIVTVVVVVLPLLGVALDRLRPAVDPPDEPRRIEFLDRSPERSERADHRKCWWRSDWRLRFGATSSTSIRVAPNYAQPPHPAARRWQRP